MLFKDGETNVCQALPEYDAMIENNSCSLQTSWWYLHSSVLAGDHKLLKPQVGYYRPEHIQYSNYHHKCLGLDNLLVGKGFIAKLLPYFNSTYGRNTVKHLKELIKFTNLDRDYVGHIVVYLSIVIFQSSQSFFVWEFPVLVHRKCPGWGLKIYFLVNCSNSPNQIHQDQFQNYLIFLERNL